MGHLQSLHEKYSDSGLLVYTIAMHPDPETAKMVTKELGITYPVFLGNGSELGEQYAYG
ncbi:MAG: hypothetical protein IIB00_02665 [candidate division Zixibacteria bacterium]|nr:hypothetical protein [candidate division Zixibacteria bacterium]